MLAFYHHSTIHYEWKTALSGMDKSILEDTSSKSQAFMADSVPVLKAVETINLKVSSQIEESEAGVEEKMEE